MKRFVLAIFSATIISAVITFPAIGDNHEDSAITISEVITVPAIRDRHKNSGNNRGHSRSGFSGSINFGAIWGSGKSQLKGDGDKHIATLGKATNSSDLFAPLPFFDLRYGFQSGTVLYLGIPIEGGEPRAEAGISQQFRGFGNLGVSFHYYLPEEVWKDPYVTGTDRETTDRQLLGGALKYEGFGIKAIYEYDSASVDEDLIGERYESLKREGNIHSLSAEYKINAGRAHIIVPGFKYTLADMDGQCNSHSGYEGKLAFMRMSRHYMLHLSAAGGIRQYDETHPIFNKEREDVTYQAMGMVAWLRPLGLEKFSFNIGGGYQKEDSNIDFYDADGIITFATVGYRFGGGGRGDDND